MEKEKQKASAWMHEIIVKSDEAFKSAAATKHPQELSIYLRVYHTLGLLKIKLEEWMQKVVEILGAELRNIVNVSIWALYDQNGTFCRK